MWNIQIELFECEYEIVVDIQAHRQGILLFVSKYALERHNV